MLVALVRERSLDALTRGVLAALPLTLFILFFFVPSTSAAIFNAFPCSEFGYDDAAGETWKFVRADLSIRCPDDSGEPTPQHSYLRAAGVALLMLWPVGVPLLFLLLCLRARVPGIIQLPTGLRVQKRPEALP